MTPGVSAGSNQVGANVTVTANVTCPAGASERPAGASERPAGASERPTGGGAGAWADAERERLRRSAVADATDEKRTMSILLGDEVDCLRVDHRLGAADDERLVALQEVDHHLGERLGAIGADRVRRIVHEDEVAVGHQVLVEAAHR